jgi:hypothetical protein
MRALFLACLYLLVWSSWAEAPPSYPVQREAL